MTTLSSYREADEKSCVEELLEVLPWDQERHDRVQQRTIDLVEKVRGASRKPGELESFLQEFGLNTEEGLALMTLAEALLRIPDTETANALIKDKMVAADWLSKQGETKDFLVKAAGFGLSLTRKTLDSAVSRLGEPVIRKAMVQAMRMLGKQFVLGRTIEEGIKEGKAYNKKGYRLSYDMLGEGARTQADADKFYAAYTHAIDEIAKQAGKDEKLRPGISIKLSALFPRYEFRQEDRCIPFLTDALRALAQQAANNNIALTVDAEEADRLETSLKIISAVAKDNSLTGWEGFGLAIQAYQKRALPLVDYLADLSKESGQKLQVRLVKGAYWDTEIKHGQILGHADYPVFTRKANTDTAYLACAYKMLEARDNFYPMFATHNAHTLASVLDMAGNDRNGFEFQRLHGMGETLHDHILKDGLAEICVYAPCGSHEELLPYLVRRLLENGASTSFVYQILDKNVPAEAIARDPVWEARDHDSKRHDKIPLPCDIYGAARKNAKGIDITEEAEITPVLTEIKDEIYSDSFEAAPFIGGEMHMQGDSIAITNPADTSDIVGQMYVANSALIDKAFNTAKEGHKIWNATPAGERADALLKLADLMEERMAELMGICTREAGKTIDDAIAEIREAIDFCRYYAARGRKDFCADGTFLPGPTGEENILTLQGRGVFVCISPWNFPQAIFTGQIAAALMAGNAVIAKPAEQTPLIAQRMAELMVEAGITPEAITILPGDGKIGAEIVAHPDVSGVAFTGSTEAAKHINRALAEKDGPIVPLIAETGGQNAMIVDSSALPEQVIDDVLHSAFGSSGQRCSALRVLYVQKDVADIIINMLKGAMAERRLGNPLELNTDIGPVIDDEARKMLEDHCAKMSEIGTKIAEAPLSDELKAQGHFFAPVAFEIDSVDLLEREVFGPVLHIIRFEASEIDSIIEQINETGYGLTFGVHSRIQNAVKKLTGSAQVGNAYINRTMTGAVVGVQPFGGQGLSGTGPKAGGPHYLYRFATEKVISTDTTRQGGNASLVTLQEDE